MHPNNWISGNVQSWDFGSVSGGADVDGFLREYAVVGDERVVVAEGYVFPGSLSSSFSSPVLLSLFI